MFRITFRHDGVKKYVVGLDGDELVSSADPGMAGAVEGEEVPWLVAALIDVYCVTKLLIEEVGLGDL